MPAELAYKYPSALEMKIAHINIDDLIFAECNPRQMTKDQHKALTDSIKRFGFVDPVIVNKHKDRKNIVIGGHQRLKIAAELGIKDIPAVYVDLTAEKERELNIRLNKNTGGWDFDALSDYFDEGELMEWGFTDIDIGWGDPPSDDDWAAYFEERGDTSGVDNTHTISFVLNDEDFERLKKTLKLYDKNKDVALMKIVDKCDAG